MVWCSTWSLASWHKRLDSLPPGLNSKFHKETHGFTIRHQQHVENTVSMKTCKPIVLVFSCCRRNPCNYKSTLNSFLLRFIFRKMGSSCCLQRWLLVFFLLVVKTERCDNSNNCTTTTATSQRPKLYHTATQPTPHNWQPTRNNWYRPPTQCHSK